MQTSLRRLLLAIALLSLPCFAALTHIESVVSSGATSTQYIATVTATSANDHIVCASFYDNTFSSLADDKTDTWSAVLAPTVFNAGPTVRVDEVKATASGMTTITETFTGNSHGALLCGHDSGLNTTTPNDKSGPFNSTGTGATTWDSGSSGVLANASEIAYGYAYCNLATNCTFAIGSGWTSGVHIGNGGAGVDMFLEYQIVSATTALNATGTINPTGNAVWEGIATFQAAAAGGSGGAAAGGTAKMGGTATAGM